MATLIPRKKADGLMSLPSEVRLQIYGYLMPKTIEINLCFPPPPEPVGLPSRKGSSVSKITLQNLDIEAITRNYGLHLLLVNNRIRSEVEPLLHKRVVRFHCPNCFDQWVPNVSYGMGVGIEWIKHIEIIFERLSSNHSMSLADLATSAASNTMRRCEETVYAYCGRMNLMQSLRATWHFDLLIEDSEEDPLWKHSQRIIPRYEPLPPGLRYGLAMPEMEIHHFTQATAQQNAHESPQPYGQHFKLWIIRGRLRV